MIILSGIILKKTRMFSGDTSAFIMELPTYHLPYALTVLKYAFDRAFSFVKRAGTIIFAMNVLIWFTSNYNWTLAHVDAGQSILADVGKVVAVVFAPLWFGEWQCTVATITGLTAKENDCWNKWGCFSLIILATVINFGRLFKQLILLFLLILYWFSISFVPLVSLQFQQFIKKWEMSDGLYVPLVSKH